MEPRGWQGALVPVILLLTVQVLPLVADCQLDDLNDYSAHMEAVYDGSDKETYRENETAQYKCQGGFYPRAPGSQFRTAVCRNGLWDKSSQSPLDCIGQQRPQGCVEPNFPHGRIVGGRPILGSIIYHDYDAIAIFDCDDGQRTAARCLPSGDWSSKPPTCTVLTSVSCGNPFPGGIVSNGRPDSLVFNFPSTIKVTCNRGYRLVAHDGSEWGTKVLQCQSDGRWNRPAPKCIEVVCPPIRDILHGRVILNPSTGTLYEDTTATYQCIGKNYVLKGAAVRRCQNNGTWSDMEPTCQGFDGCVKPDLPNGRVLATGAEMMLGNISYYPYDTTVIFDCDDGRQKTSSKCQQSGNWNPEPPICSPVKTATSSSSSTTTTTTTTTTRAPATQCSPLPSPTSGKLFTVDGFRINASVVFSCDEGYTMRGPSTLVCRPGGAWDPPTMPTCTAPPPWIIILSICLAVLASLVLCCLGFFYIMRRRRRRTPPAQGYRRQIRKPGPYDAISNEEVARLGKPLPVTSL